LNSLKILLADDETDVTDRYASYLKRSYKDVYTAYDGLEAYRIYMEKSPDVAILDLQMPGLTGLEILQRIRKKDKTTQVIILSAHSEKSMIEEAMHSHIYEYVVKPITRGELKEMLEKLKIQNKKEGKSYEI
jgi:two-component system, OmpR family, response regulator VanR